MVKSNQSLYFEFKKLLFEAKKVLLDENGKQKIIKDIQSSELQNLYGKIAVLANKVVLAIDSNLGTEHNIK